MSSSGAHSWPFIRCEPQCVLVSSQLGEDVQQNLSGARSVSPLLPVVVSSSPVFFWMPGFPHGRRSSLDLESPPLAAFPSRRSIGPYASIFPAHFWLLQRVPVFPLLALHFSPRWERSPGIAPGRPSVSGGVSMWCRTRQPSRSCPTNKGNKASAISSSSCALAARASGGSTQHSSAKALVKTMITSFQVEARRLHSRSASHICLILYQPGFARYCSLPLVGS